MPRLLQTGDVSIKPFKDTLPDESYIILLLGVTGCGKSSFIEALAGPGQKLGISGGTLHSVTQKVAVFQMINIGYEWSYEDIRPVYVVDTPGFSDNRQSDAKTVRKIQAWVEKNSRIDLVFYFCRITDKRITRSTQGPIQIIKSLGMWYDGLTIVTTMWDTVPMQNHEAQAHAASNFAQLHDIWKDEVENGARFVKFLNNQLSAISILTFREAWRHCVSNFGNNPATALLIFEELLQRIQKAHGYRQFLQEDRSQILTDPNRALFYILTCSLREIDRQLASHVDQLLAFRHTPQGFDGDVNIQSIAYQCVLDMTSSSKEFMDQVGNELFSYRHPRRSRDSYLYCIFKAAKEEFSKAYNIGREFALCN
ncbi:hypothetical protein CVT24_001601 [Panaeolus cyanescens]|uniref:G domain-containing protein n=1 Tax=Panaeolus cyanescens TaxID=181874 RepID=A0A409YFD5_9AGAR|nr:hypothetical protein CVT24_001601 [Panaeolus cyanescens]